MSHDYNNILRELMEALTKGDEGTSDLEDGALKKTPVTLLRNMIIDREFHQGMATIHTKEAQRLEVEIAKLSAQLKRRVYFRHTDKEGEVVAYHEGDERPFEIRILGGKPTYRFQADDFEYGTTQGLERMGRDHG